MSGEIVEQYKEIEKKVRRRVLISKIGKTRLKESLEQAQSGQQTDSREKKPVDSSKR